MNDIKYTLKGITCRQNRAKTPLSYMIRKTWKDYVLLAAMATIAATAFLLMAGTGFSDSNFGFISIFAVAVVATLFASVRAHRSMLSVILTYEKRELGTRRRNVVLVEMVALSAVTLSVAVLPPFVIFLSTISAAHDVINVAMPPIPLWETTAFILTTFTSMLFVESILTFARLCFRECSPSAATNNLENDCPRKVKK